VGGARVCRGGHLHLVVGHVVVVETYFERVLGIAGERHRGNVVAAGSAGGSDCG
jgi:catechol-2,3-dioxygenase